MTSAKPTGLGSNAPTAQRVPSSAATRMPSAASGVGSRHGSDAVAGDSMGGESLEEGGEVTVQPKPKRRRVEKYVFVK